MLGAGAPDDFGITAVAGLDALLALDEGSLGLNGNRWTLTGGVADAASRDAIQSALAGKINAANWQIAIQARDSAPVVTPYLWSATKGTDGIVDLAGYLPNQALQAFSAVRAINPGRDTTAIASGEPSGFADDLLAGLEALTHVTDGKAAFDGSRWVLTGTVASQEQGEAAIAALIKGSRNGSQWTSALSGYQLPAPEVSSSSSEPSSSTESSSEAPVSSAESSSETQPVSSEVAASSSSEPSSEPSAEPSSSEPSSELLSSEPSSSEPPSSEMPSVGAVLRGAVL